MADYISHVMWYTVYDTKSGELVAAGTSEMCAAKLGYKSANSFASAVGHSINGRSRHKSKRYTFVKEYIPRNEVDSLLPVHRKRKNPAGVGAPTGCKG